jgi:hypothetical protein
MAWYFNFASGTPDLRAGDLTIWDGLSEFSVHARCYLKSTYLSDKHTVFSHYDGTNGFRLYYTNSGVNGKVQIPKLLVTIGGSTKRAEGATDYDFPNSQWVSFGGWWKAGQSSDGIACLINGVQKGITDTSGHGNFPSLTTSTQIGATYVGGSECWDGYIGEVCAWNVALAAEEWEALADGAPGYAVRPTALIFHSLLEGFENPDHYWLPGDDTRAAFTHDAVAVQDDESLRADIWDQDAEGDVPGPTGTVWGAWSKVGQEVVPSQYRDSSVVNGTTYKYRVVARDTSLNESDPGTESDPVTPQTGIQGVRLPPATVMGRERAKMIRSTREAIPGVWRDD